MRKLGAPMMPEGFELEIFYYVLKPLCKGLSKKKRLQELYFDEMVPQFGDPIEALKYLWFGVSVVGTISPKPLLPLLHGTLTISGEVLYRRLLSEVALELGSDVEKSKRFIEFVVNTGELEDVSNARDYMPPEEKHGNDKAFVPYILKIFQEADSQAVIAPDDLVTLIKWLNDCKLRKLSSKISKFSHKEEFSHKCK